MEAPPVCTKCSAFGHSTSNCGVKSSRAWKPRAQSVKFATHVPSSVQRARELPASLISQQVPRSGTGKAIISQVPSSSKVGTRFSQPQHLDAAF